MELVKIKGTVITNQYGTLSDGDLLRCSPEFAKHLVNDCNAAEYVKAKEVEIEAHFPLPSKAIPVKMKKAKG